ncbi:MAG TPA: thiamine phosphate synthase [Gemmatimonadales bacterium]|jgi:thiamine-phosphate pyrophosphorylase
MVQNLANHLRLMLVTDDLLLGERDPVAVCQAAERGGVTAVQLRLKQASPRALLDVARRLKAVLRVPVIVNDRPDVARAAGCWVHLGPDDVPVSVARRLFTQGEVIGASVGSIAEVARGEEADYWGIGPLNGSATKLDAGPSLGIAGFQRIVAQAGGRPCVAIGGVRPEDVGPVIAAGGVGVAVVSGILGAVDIEEAVRKYLVPST